MGELGEHTDALAREAIGTYPRVAFEFHFENTKDRRDFETWLAAQVFEWTHERRQMRGYRQISRG